MDVCECVAYVISDRKVHRWDYNKGEAGIGRTDGYTMLMSVCCEGGVARHCLEQRRRAGSMGGRAGLAVGSEHDEQTGCIVVLCRALSLTLRPVPDQHAYRRRSVLRRRAAVRGYNV